MHFLGASKTDIAYKFQCVYYFHIVCIELHSSVNFFPHLLTALFHHSQGTLCQQVENE